MFNNITNFFNLIVGRKIKTAATVEDTDLVPLGTRDPRFLGDYQPTAISVQDLQTAIGFNGVAVDGITIIGDGTNANPLQGTATPGAQVVLFANLATTEPLKPCTYNNGIAGVGATLTGNANGQLSTISFTDKIDNVTTALNQIILVRSQTNQTQNGLYLVTQLGDALNPFILTRTTDADTQAELYPIQVNVFNGATQANVAFLQKTVDPIVGTNNIVFTTTFVGLNFNPVQMVDTVTLAPLPACTYTNGTNLSLPGSGAALTANANGPIGTINGTPLTNGMRILVRDQVNAAHNGDYTVAAQGSAGSPWKLVRSTVWGSNFVRLQREWKVNNPTSGSYGARYSVNIASLASVNVGITPLVFVEILPSGLPPWIEYNGTDLTLWCNGQGNVSTNTTYGDQALKSNTIGSSNTAIGLLALKSNTIGSGNIAVGRSALLNNIDGVNNLAIGNGALETGTSSSKLVAIGHDALKNNTIGQANTAIGYGALSQNISGNQNTAVGPQALTSNNGDYNTAIGSNALNTNTTGQSNVAVGKESLFFNSIGINNTAVGAQAALSNIDGSWNTTVGNGALNSNQSGNYNTAIGGGALQLNTASCNTAVGYGTLVLNTNGFGNVALGCTSLYFNTGNSNTGLGNGALFNNTAGSYNTAVGQGALNVNTVGDYNTAVGQGTDSGNFSGSVIIGKDATATGNNQFVVGSALTNAGTVTNAAAAQTHYWTVKINGTDYKILLGT